MSTEYLPPDGHILDSIANGPFRWSIVTGEWIDNAFDAGATSVAFEFGKKTLTIEDDGHGCADPRLMVQLGSHGKQATTRLGRYGIGGKDAALLVGGVDSTITIQTTHGGVRRAFSVDWARHRRDWAVDSPVEEPSNDRPGTHISINKIARSLPDWQGLLAELGYVYSSALKYGRQIKIKRPGRSEWELVKRWEPPQLSDVIDVRVSVAGKGARVYCGIVSGPNPKSGFTYYHAWRVIEPASANGCGVFSPSRICGFVELDDTWTLTRNKDGIGRDRELLYAEVERVCRPTLEKAEAMSIELQSKILAGQVSDALNQMIGRAKAKARRGKGKTNGTAHPTGLGQPHLQAVREQPGDRFPRRESGYRVTPQILGDEARLGEVKDQHVLINVSNPTVAKIWRDQNHDAILVVAASLVGFLACYAPKATPKFEGFELHLTPEDFSRAAGKILSVPTSIDGGAEHIQEVA